MLNLKGKFLRVRSYIDHVFEGVEAVTMVTKAQIKMFSLKPTM